MHPLWMSRDSDLVTFCDTGSRIIDRADFSASKGLFWAANERARRMWGRGFTHDRFASTLRVQPVDCPWKLPFTARHHQAFASSADALASDWRGSVNWVNAPFALIGKVYAIVRHQQAVAAVIVPRGRKRWWSPLLSSNAEGVVMRWNLDGDDERCQMVGEEAPAAYRKGLAIVFLDFRRRTTDQPFKDTLAAEDIWGAWHSKGRPTQSWRYYDQSGCWVETVPRQPLPVHPRL